MMISSRYIAATMVAILCAVSLSTVGCGSSPSDVGGGQTYPCSFSENGLLHAHVPYHCGSAETATQFVTVVQPSNGQPYHLYMDDAGVWATVTEEPDNGCGGDPSIGDAVIDITCPDQGGVFTSDPKPGSQVSSITVITLG